MTYDFLYMFHARHSTINGRYWMTEVCFNDQEGACAKEYPIFSVQTAEPYFYALGDGYFGLDPRAISAMQREGMISEPVFGVHTHMFNSTEDPSQIRFGGYNEELFKEGHSQVWLPTVNNTSWELDVNNVQFHGDSLINATSEGQRAIINPAFPFIGMPHSIFEQFK